MFLDFSQFTRTCEGFVVFKVKLWTKRVRDKKNERQNGRKTTTAAVVATAVAASTAKRE